MLKFLQRIGKAIMLPIAVLPIAGILLGIGGSLLGIGNLENAPGIYGAIIIFVNFPIVNAILTVMNDIGSVVFSNLPILFAVGVTIGLAKKETGTAALASIVGYLVMTQVISTLLSIGVTQLGVITSVETAGDFSTYVINSLGITTLNMSVFGGIIVGVVTSTLHNKYCEIQLPEIIGFFSGARFIPIVTALAMALIGAILAFGWPVIQNGIELLANLVKDAGLIGTFLYGLIERALVPFGLHHVFYTPFWYGSFVQADVIIDGTKTVIDGANTAYFAQIGSMSDLVGASRDTMSTVVSGTTRFMAGKFPFMMFGLPAAAFAMYKNANPKKKKIVGSLLLSAALTSFLTGITEPLEFTFLFVAPVLYVVHAVLAGLSFMLMHLFSVFVGMTFSGGLIDFTLFGLLPAGAGIPNNWYMILLVGIAYAVIYYFVFSFLIKKLKLKTPGREDDNEEVKLFNKSDYKNKKSSGSSAKTEIQENAPYVLEALGNKENIVSVGACITRLRVEVKDKSVVDKDKLKSLGAVGVMEVGNGVQVVFGAKADGYKNEINKILGKN